MRFNARMQTLAEILTDKSFVDVLVALDRELCAAVKARDCPVCGSKLDVANYDRKLRAAPFLPADAQAKRLSLCCRREGCRKRELPPSVRFLGRRVYLGAVVMLGAVLRQGPTPWRLDKLSEVLGADRRTLQRWRAWWTERVGNSRTFEIGRADFMPPPAGSALPGSLLECFFGTAAQRVLRALCWLAEHFGSRFPKDGGLHAEVAR